MKRASAGRSGYPPDSERVERDLRVRQHAGEEDEHLEVPDLERQHHRRRDGKAGEPRQVGEGGPCEPGPRVPAPRAPQDVRELGQDEDPPREAERERGPEQAQAQRVHGDPAERHVEREAGGQDVGAGRHDALRLQELLDGEVGGVREDLRDEAEDVDPGGAGDPRRLAEEDEDRTGEGVMTASGTPAD